MSTGHTVRLPHPNREGFTVGACECGWRVHYQWGGHGAATRKAEGHIL